MSAARTVFAGLVGTTAVSAAMRLARRQGLTTMRFSRVLGTLFGPDVKSRRAVGQALFFANGVLLALGYRTAMRATGNKGSIAGGAVLGAAHGAIAAAAAETLTPLHPRPQVAGLREGSRPKPSSLTAGILVAVHALYGAVLGAFARNRV